MSFLNGVREQPRGGQVVASSATGDITRGPGGTLSHRGEALQPGSGGGPLGFLTGNVQNIDTTPPDVRAIREMFGGALMGELPGAVRRGFGPLGDYGSGADMQFFLQNLLKPYQQMFAAQREGVLAQAKESAGNLTGSGYNNILGSAAAESLANEQGILAGILNQLRGQEINRGLTLRGQDIGRQSDLLRLILGFSSSGFPNQPAYQPGFLDYAAPIAGTVLGAKYGAR